MSIFGLISKGADVVSGVAKSIGGIFGESDRVYYNSDMSYGEFKARAAYYQTGPLKWIPREDGFIEVLNDSQEPVMLSFAKNWVTENGAQEHSKAETHMIAGLASISDISHQLREQNVNGTITVNNAHSEQSGLTREEFIAGKRFSYGEVCNCYTVTNLKTNTPSKIDEGLWVTINIDGKESEGDQVTVHCAIDGWPDDTSGRVDCSIFVGSGPMIRGGVSVSQYDLSGDNFKFKVAENVEFEDMIIPKVFVDIYHSSKSSRMLKMKVHENIHPMFLK